MASYYGKGSFSPKIRIFILIWTFLHNVTISFGGYLLLLYYKKSKMHMIQTPFDRWSPDSWFAVGFVVGGVLMLVLSHHLVSKSLLCVTRGLQLTTIAIIFCFYTMQNNDWAMNYWSIGIYCTFILQGSIDCMSRILTPIYVMETICDRNLSRYVTFLLLLTTQLPLHMSSFTALLISKHRLFLTLGVGTFSGILAMVTLAYLFLPKPSKDGRLNDKNDHVEFWHLQFERDSGWLRPALTSLSLCLLSQLAGHQMYKFYASWSLRLVSLPIDSELLTSAIPFITLLLLLPIWFKNRISPVLISTTLILFICLFISGTLLHGLEGGANIYHFAPIILFMTYMIAYSAGLDSLSVVVSVLLLPRQYRVGVLTVTTVSLLLTGRLARAVTPTLIDWFHPYGVFWLHGWVVLGGLLYIAFSIVGQLSHRHKGYLPGRTTVEQFITQV